MAQDLGRQKPVVRYREDPIEEFARAIKRGLRDLTFTSDQSMTRSCLNCHHFNEDIEVCNKAIPPNRPPARVIAFGCPSYFDVNDIPF